MLLEENIKDKKQKDNDDKGRTTKERSVDTYELETSSTNQRNFQVLFAPKQERRKTVETFI